MATLQPSLESLSTTDGSESSWLDLLPGRKLFSHLREQGSGSNANISGNIMCTVSENLFVWSREESALLTVNLKRLCAAPDDDNFQTLLCPLPGFFDEKNYLLELVPEGNGRYIALHCKRGVAVVHLHYHRGQYGEFSGGGSSVMCRTARVSSDVFTINDQLTLTQVSWYPVSPDTLVLLTSDNCLRLFNLAQPNLPLLELSLTSSNHISFYQNTIKLEEYCIVGFSVWHRSAFVYHDSGDVSLVSLSQHSRPQQLSMHPQDTTGNYICSSASMLLLEGTVPLAVVLAGKSGMDDMMMCHCLYLDDSSEDYQQVEDTSSRDAQRLYVVESIKIQSNQPDISESDYTLHRDPANPHGYFVRHPEGVHAVHLPWLRKLQAFTSTDMSSLVSEAECKVNYLISTEPNFTSLQGFSVVWEPRLGYALIGVTYDEMECLTLPLDDKKWTLEHGEQGLDEVDWAPPAMHNYSNLLTNTSSFMKTIRGVLHPEDEEFAPPMMSRKPGVGEGSSESQAKCLQFLMQSIKQLRLSFVIRQMQALKETEKRVVILSRLKEQIISDITRLRDERDELDDNCKTLQLKARRLAKKNAILQDRAKKMVCRVELRSPVLSEAEQCMMKELEGLTNHFKKMDAEIQSAVGKLRLCREMSVVPEVDLNASQSASLLRKLTDNAEKIKTMRSTVMSLCGLCLHNHEPMSCAVCNNFIP